MRNHRPVRGIRLVVAVSTGLTLLVGCSGGGTPSSSTAGTNTPASNSGTVFGPSQRLGNGTVKTYTTLDASERCLPTAGAEGRPGCRSGTYPSSWALRWTSRTTN
jgi:hypothetical protein